MDYTLEQRAESIIAECMKINSTNPYEIFKTIAEKDYVRIHGPEHHILDGACILTAFHNAGGDIDLHAALQKLMSEGLRMPGAACGLWGVCGAVTSIGAALAIIDGTGPLSTEDWGNHMEYTSTALARLAHIGGPRCCKRDAFSSLEQAVEYINKHYNISLDIPSIKCDFSPQNEQCIGDRCPYCKHMGKPLSEMTLEELWELFPIILTEHQEIWSEWYGEEQRRLAGILPSDDIRISHVGSTAIDNIWAKPIIDILVELPVSLSMESVKEILVQNGYICMSEQPNRKSFNLGYTSDGFAKKVFHLHLRYRGDHDELYFRDYMNENPLLAKQYEELKLSLWKKFEHDRDGYTSAKTGFVEEYTRRAKEYFGNRY